MTDIFSGVQLEKRFGLATLLHLTMAVTIGLGHGKSGFRRRKALISVKRGKIGPRLLLRTNRKSHTRFRLMPKSTTLDDLEGSLCTLFQTHASFEAHHENVNEDMVDVYFNIVIDYSHSD